MPLCWEKPPFGLAYVFHYTSPPNARQILADGVFAVGRGELFGKGLYATNIAPEHLPADELHRRLFFHLWPPEYVDGVVVLVRNDDLRPFESVAPDFWLIRGDAEIPVEDIAVGAAVRTSSGWAYDSSLYA